MQDSYGPRGEDMSKWLVEAAKRTRVPSAAQPAPRQESPEDIVRYLEELTERKLRSRADIVRLLKDVMQENLSEARVLRRRQKVKEIILVGALVAAFAHYEYWDIKLQLASIPSVQVFIPDSSPASSHRSQNTAYRA